MRQMPTQLALHCTESGSILSLRGIAVRSCLSCSCPDAVMMFPEFSNNLRTSRRSSRHRKGRMFDHVGIVVADLERSARFYGRVLAPLGLQILERHRRGPNDGWVVMSTGAPRSPFFVIAAGRPSFWGPKARVSASPVHLCFTAPSQEAVNRFHSLGLELGARDNGVPGVRRAPFYCAFLIDFDGNNVEAGLYLGDVAPAERATQATWSVRNGG